MAIKDSIELEIKRTVKVNMTGDQWGLYTASMDCSGAVAALNAELESAVNAGKNREEVRQHMTKLQNVLSQFGAADTEGRYALEDALDSIFGGREEGEWM